MRFERIKSFCILHSRFHLERKLFKLITTSRKLVNARIKLNNAKFNNTRVSKSKVAEGGKKENPEKSERSWMFENEVSYSMQRNHRLLKDDAAQLRWFIRRPIQRRRCTSPCMHGIIPYLQWTNGNSRKRERERERDARAAAVALPIFHITQRSCCTRVLHAIYSFSDIDFL